MIVEGKWYLVSSYEDATILIDNYKTNTVTKFSWRSSSFQNNSSGYSNIGNKILQIELTIVFITLSRLFNAFITVMI